MGLEFVKRLSYILAPWFFFSTIIAVGTAAVSDELVLKSIEVIEKDDKLEQVVFKLSGSHTPKSFRINGDNPRLVFDFFGVKYPSDVTRIDDVGGAIISGIRVGRHNDPPKTRVVVDIQKDSPYLYEQSFNVSNNSLVVNLSPDYPKADPEESAAQPPRIEAESNKIAVSVSQIEPDSDPTETNVKEAGKVQDTPVEIAETPSQQVQKTTISSPKENSDTPSAPSPPVQPSKPSSVDQPSHAAKQDLVEDEPASKEEDLAQTPETPVKIAATSPVKVKESATSTSEIEKVASTEPPPVQPSESSGMETDQPTEGTKQERSAEPPAIDEEAGVQDRNTAVEIAAAPPEKIQEPSGASPDPAPVPEEQSPEPSGSDLQSQVAKMTPSPEPQSTEPADIVPVLLDVSFEQSINESETVLFRLNHFYPPLVFGIEKGEPRVVCDFFDAEIDQNIPPVIEAGGQFVNRIMVRNEAEPDKVRVELVLMPNRNYDLQQLFFKEDNLFVVIVKELQEDSAAAN